MHVPLQNAVIYTQGITQIHTNSLTSILTVFPTHTYICKMVFSLITHTHREHSKRKVGNEAEALAAKAFKNYELAIQMNKHHHEAAFASFERLWEQGNARK